MSSLSIFAAAHTCIHDSHIIPHLRENPPNILPQPKLKNNFNNNVLDNNDEIKNSYKNNQREAEQQSLPSLDASRPPRPAFPKNPLASPIRYNFTALDLFNSSKYCTAVGETRPDFKGGSLTCNLAEEILTPEKRDGLLNVLLPYALNKMSNILSVIPLTSPLAGMTASTCGGQLQIPQDHIDNGINNTDFVFYVSAGLTPTGNIAWASHCSVDSDGRPIIGRLNAAPRYIPSPPYTPDVIENYARTLVHEVLHASGFSSGFFQDGFLAPGAATNSSAGPAFETISVRGGVPAQVVNTSLVVNASRYFYNCSTCPGMELELEGGIGTAGSHWNRRNLFESVMVGVDGIVDSIDLLTLSLFASMPYYWVNESMVEPMYFGNNTGCDLSEKTCTDPTLNKKTESLFCSVETATSTTSLQMCDYNLKSRGRCNLVNFTDDLPSFWQYYPGKPKQGGEVALMEYCPFVASFSSYYCPRGNLTTGTLDDKNYGHTWGASARCFNAPTLIRNIFVKPAPTVMPTRCLVAKCLYDGCDDPFQDYEFCKYRLQIQVRDTTFVDCPHDGSSGAVTSLPTGFWGEINCPAASEICHPLGRGWGEDLKYEKMTTTTTTFTSTSDASGSTPPPPATTTTSTTTSTTASPTPAPPTLTTIYNLSTTTSTSTTTIVAALTSSTSMTTTSTTTVGASLTASPPSSSSVSSTSSASSTQSAASTTTTDPGNNNNGGASGFVGDINPAICFLGNLPCYVSYILIAVAGIFVLLIFYGIYRKCCGNNVSDNSKDENRGGNSGNHGITPVDLALMGANAPIALHHHQPQQKQQPQQPQGRNYAQMKSEMKNMTPREIAQSFGVAPTQNPPPPPTGGVAFSGVSPGARYIEAELQQISPVQKPVALGQTRRPSAVFYNIDDDL